MFQSIMTHPAQPDVYVGFAPVKSEGYATIQAQLTHRLQFSTLLVSTPDALFARVTSIIELGAANCVSDILEIAVTELEK
jgi:hypothetical protein